MGAPKSDMGEVNNGSESGGTLNRSGDRGQGPSLDHARGAGGTPPRPPAARPLNRAEVPAPTLEPSGGGAVPGSLVTILPGPNGPAAG
jgi:hypothetical protein